jgi:hypothetical protein
MNISFSLIQDIVFEWYHSCPLHMVGMLFVFDCLEVFSAGNQMLQQVVITLMS